MYSRNNLEYKYNSNLKLNQDIKDKITSKYNVFSGEIITFQVMLAETWEDVQEWSTEEYYGVETELATTPSISNHFKVPSARLLYIVDNLIEKEMVFESSNNLNLSIKKNIIELQYKIALDIILN